MYILLISALVAVASADRLLFKPRSSFAIVCPDMRHECPTGNTCCILPTKEYGCCPAPNVRQDVGDTSKDNQGNKKLPAGAVCCPGGKYCCPGGSQCLPSGQCKKGTEVFTSLLKTKAKLISQPKDTSVIYSPMKVTEFGKRPQFHNLSPIQPSKPRSQDNCTTYECPTGTCCMSPIGGPFCCPLNDAVCCKDGECCPYAFTCDPSSSPECQNGTHAVPSMKSSSVIQTGSVICPDQESECADGQTCCKLDSGEYGCCPLPDAVCCSDGKHCCPHGSTCELAVQKCKSENGFVDLFEKVSAKKTTSVMCPDGKSECSDGDTCCPMDGGKYGCCPTADAKCCSDHIHCCPSGYMCDEIHQQCIGRHGKRIRWIKTVPPRSNAIDSLTIPNVVCPDGQSNCKTGQTCCKLASGNYGCCPIPKAVCCSDGRHCCPEGTTCDVASGKCNRGDLVVMDWFEKEAASVEMVKCPDGRSECKSEQTCCKLASGNYGCCPIPKAVCCSDGRHCCPEGTTCDVASGKCNRGDLVVMDWFEKEAASVEMVKCPDGRSECKSEQTCCKLASGNYGCCPIPKAVCCSDGRHCCPEGTTCDVASGKCNRGDLVVMDWFEKEAASVEMVKCPDGRSECKSEQTCCKLASGNYGCCPIPKAVCCSDGRHCCPEGTTCDVASGKCNRGDLVVMDWFEKEAASVEMVKCPDGRSECKSEQTCCKLASGNYGCCPIPKAVCCSDGRHCCPEGTTCDVASGKCNRGDLVVMDWFEKEAASVEMVKCPDGRSECKSEQTCCKLASGNYGCCPIPKAVCCSDGRHCCPEGTTCDVASGKCNRGDLVVMDWFEKEAASLEMVKCPDGRSECKSEQTCCKLASGNYGCCPIPKAVCCSDGRHCCPEGTTCDVASGKCNRGDLVVMDWFEKEAASVEMVKCPDGRSECKSEQTCCKLASGNYGCCPIPKAVCCSDGRHCCPEGTTCDVASGKCNRGDLVVMDWFEKEAASLEMVKCPDGRSECKSEQTCCKLASGNYGCCPIPKAVCCSDGRHCCPEGTTCDVASGKCNRGDLVVMDWFEKEAASLEMVKCPDGRSECKSEQTCCKLASGNYGCCPIPKAVCCSDGRHCCPEGTTCDVASGKCNRGDLVVMDWFEKEAASVEMVKCPDGRSECKSEQTCCKLASGNYGCCPIPKAVCCSDGRHCCPEGTTCDVASGKCNRGDLVVMDWFEKEAASLEMVKCPDGRSECKSEQTCCKLASGNYGCCPIPKAVCCSDGRHCCPEGTTCDVASGKCNRGDLVVMDWFEKEAASLEMVKCPDGRSECKSEQTCCKLASGNYGCCPIPKAVCCSDGRHCCPEGTTCDVASGKCNRGDLVVMNWFEKEAASVEMVKCPDGRSECKSEQTCCKLASGNYGCCPIPKAVCCSDGRHCCPEGTTCDVASGKCNRGDLVVMDWFEKEAASVEMVKCPDGRSECKSEQTCCKLASGNYGCCPIPKAVCCSDGRHCCPEGTTCDVASGKCNRGDLVVMDWFEKEAASVEMVKCPDGRSECKSEQTCCKLASGNYGCCPIPKAVCCSDGRHCCPEGTTCDVASGKCNRGDLVVMDWFEKEAASVEMVKCPDGRSECKSEQTCCKLASGNYGCCPIPKAVCCSDGRHCCPEGTTCDVASGKCNRGDLVVMDWFEKEAASVEMVKCPDGRSECKSEQTCCKLASGNYGCCPIPKAVCCSDGRHCCPEGTTCDVASGKCNRGDLVVMDWFEKGAASVEMVKCPDGRSECKSEQTCCKLASGNYGCCPIPKAVCCSDGRHCCPEGTTCDVASGKCNRGDLVVMDWFEKEAASVEMVKCPDGRSECKSEQTCCKLASGNYGCCPIPKAVCCSDGRHCCPEGTTCDVASGKCNRGDLVVMNWFVKEAASVEMVKCPDGRSECKSEQTCCKLASGNYGCCPIPKAVCCSDGRHCCPEGTTCDVASGKCNRGDLVMMDWFEKEAASVEMVKCPDGRSECKSEQTCCKLASGNYGCCPIPKAVCCSDGRHCCPDGTTCDVTSGKCLKQDGGLTEWFAKVAAKSKSIICPDDVTACKSGQTCCKNDKGYLCCPLPMAVCCSDQRHCCPHGTTCNITNGGCDPTHTHSPSLVARKPLISLTKPKDGIFLPVNHDASHPVLSLQGSATTITCPDGQTTCPDTNVCCKTIRNGAYTCCPYLNGVCCTNSNFCCPHKYVCDEEPGICRIPFTYGLVNMAKPIRGTPLN